jgi:pantoate--beta-alanine ligase
MKIASTVAELRAARQLWAGPVGVVPTMGALHAGHASLIARSVRECASTIVTIFVNPAQFGPNEDLSRYPRPIERDLALCEEYGASLVFTPGEGEMYPSTFSTTVSVRGLADRFEGASRPGHFDGVCTVVARLLGLTRADRAYFGEKDYQQLQVVRRLVADLAIPVQIVPCETVREPDGLALSSRNVYLSPEERVRALGLSRALQEAQLLAAEGEWRPDQLRGAMRKMAARSGLTIDYLEVVDKDTLEPLDALLSEARAIGAVRVGSTRLIDNAPLRLR